MSGREREGDRATDREKERQREKNGVWIMCGETPRELETLEREIEAAHASLRPGIKIP